MNRKTEELEEIIGYHFKNKHYLTQALTHSSYANEKKLGKVGCNERLEFLGDSVLSLAISSLLFQRLRELPVDVAVAAFTTETPARVSQILDLLFNAQPFDSEFTRGLYYTNN